MGVRDPWRDPKFLCGRKRSKCRPKSSIAREIKTQGNGYHPDLELSDRSWEILEMRTHGYGYHPDLELSDRSRE